MILIRLVQSLLGGRNNAPLSDQEIRRASSTFLGLDNKVNVRYEANTTTRFIAAIDEDGHEFGEIVFSNDIYPGRNIANPNAALTLKGAAAHELTHHYRWQDKTELPHGELTDIDEAMTSLEAALRYTHALDTTDIQGLISDSLHRLRLFLDEQQREHE
jgi:hypothetical protein